MPPLLLLIAAVAAVIAALVWWKFGRQKPPQRPLRPQAPVPAAPAPPTAPFPPRFVAPSPITAAEAPAMDMAMVPEVAAAPPATTEPPPTDAIAPAAPASPMTDEAGAPLPQPREPGAAADPSDLDEFAELSEFVAQEEGPPIALNSFAWVHESELPEAERKDLMDAIGGMPCPPQSLRQLLAPDFLERIGPMELAELLHGEPLLAAKVLAAVNAAFYGLSQPVQNIEHAVAFLGMETVRNICVQYLMAQAFKPELSASQRSFDSIWRASSIASELALRLGKALGLPDYGTLATKVVLAFVGHLATAALLPRQVVDEWLMRSRMERAQMEQDEIGLSAGELGSLVLRLWQLPDSLVKDVSDSSQVLVTPASACDPKSVPHLALMYLCVGLGERLALGEMFALAGYDPADDRADANYHLRSYLQDPALAGLNDVLNSPEMAAVVQQMRGTGASWP